MSVPVELVREAMEAGNVLAQLLEADLPDVPRTQESLRIRAAIERWEAALIAVGKAA